MSPLDTILDEPLGSRSHVVTLRGAIDVDAARELERRPRDLALEGKRTIVADLSGAEELTPSLLGALIRAQRSLSWRHGRLLLSATPRGCASGSPSCVYRTGAGTRRTGWRRRSAPEWGRYATS